LLALLVHRPDLAITPSKGTWPMELPGSRVRSRDRLSFCWNLYYKLTWAVTREDVTKWRSSGWSCWAF
jgi:hypothetical protein